MRVTPRPRSLALLALVAVAGGTCTVAEAQPIAIVSGNNQTGVVSTQLPNSLVIRVGGIRPLVGIPVTWFVFLGSGTVSPARTFTDADGLAQTTFTLGSTPGTATVLGTIADGAAAFRLTAVAASPLVVAPVTAGVSIEMISGNK